MQSRWTWTWCAPFAMPVTETVTDPGPKESEIAGTGGGGEGRAGVALARGAGARVEEDAGVGCAAGELARSGGAVCDSSLVAPRHGKKNPAPDRQQELEHLSSSGGSTETGNGRLPRARARLESGKSRRRGWRDDEGSRFTDRTRTPAAPS